MTTHPSSSIHAPCLELLEPRLAPAGIVTISLSGQGALTVTGDSAANQLEIYDQGDGDWGIRSLSGDYPVTFRHNGSDSAELHFTTPIKSLKSNLKGGEDILQLTGLSISGPVTVQGFKDASRDTISIQDSSIPGAVKIQGNARNNTIEIHNSLLGHTSLNALGVGENDISISNSTLTGNLAIRTTGDDSISLLGGNYRHISITQAGPQSEFDLISEVDQNVQVLGNLTYKHTGISSTNMKIGGDEIFITGNLTLAIQRSSSALVIGTPYVEGVQDIHIGGNLTYTGSTHFSSLTNAHGSDAFGALNFTVEGTLSVLSRRINLGTYDTTLDIGSLKINATGEKPEVEIQAQNLTVGSLHYKSTAHESRFYMHIQDTLSVEGNVSLQARPNKDYVDIIAPHLEVGGSLSASISYFRILTGDGTLGSLIFKGSRFGSNLQLDHSDATPPNEPTLSILGDAKINQGRGINNTALFRGVHIHGDLTLSTTALEYYAHGDEGNVSLLDTQVDGDTRLRFLGTASNTLLITNSTFHGHLTADMGVGDDSIILGPHGAMQGSYPPIPSVSTSVNHFQGDTRFLLGKGQDLLTSQPLTEGQNIQNHFTGSFRADGGSDTDTLALANLERDYFTTPPSLTNFAP